MALLIGKGNECVRFCESSAENDLFDHFISTVFDGISEADVRGTDAVENTGAVMQVNDAGQIGNLISVARFLAHEIKQRGRERHIHGIGEDQNDGHTVEWSFFLLRIQKHRLLFALQVVGIAFGRAENGGVGLFI